MVLDPQFLDWMPYTVTVSNAGTSGTDAYGGRALVSSFSWQCRIEQQSRLYTAKDGREVRSNATLFGPPYDTSGTTIAFKPTPVITLPTGVMIAGSSQPPILDVFQEADETGVMYYEVTL